jgi:hypothetical protein
MITELMIFALIAVPIFLGIAIWRGVIGVLSTGLVFWLLLAAANVVGWLIIIGIFAGLSALFGGTLPSWVSLPIILIGPTATALLGIRFRSEVHMVWPHIAAKLLWGLLWVGGASLFGGVLAYYGHQEPFSLIAISLGLSSAGLMLFRYASRRWDMRHD